MVGTREDVLALLDRVLDRTDAPRAEALYMGKYACAQIIQDADRGDAGPILRQSAEDEAQAPCCRETGACPSDQRRGDACLS